MLRNTFLAVLTVLAVAAVAQATTTLGAPGDNKTSVVYDSATGNFTLQPDGQAVGLFWIRSATSIFSGMATLPGGGLGFDVNAANEKAWAALPANAVSANFNLSNIAAPGLTQDFLLGDLTIDVSGGFGTDNRLGDLVYLGDTSWTAAAANQVGMDTRVAITVGAGEGLMGADAGAPTYIDTGILSEPAMMSDSSPGADGNGDDMIEPADYVIWPKHTTGSAGSLKIVPFVPPPKSPYVARPTPALSLAASDALSLYGNGIAHPGTALSLAAIPEPSSLMLLVVLSACLTLRRTNR
jgi:hypothetical protein